MKKYYFVFCCLLSITFAYSQVFIPISNIVRCEGSQMEENLTNYVEIIGNPGDYTLSYSSSDWNGTQIFPIENPTQYPVFNTQVIHVTCVNNTTNEVSNATFNIIVNPLPIANPAVLNFCSDTELPIYDLNDAVPQIITAPLENYTITFYDSPVGGNVIVGGTFVPTVLPVQLLGARVYDTQTGCLSEQVPITLNTNNDCTPPQPCPPPSVLSVSNVTPTSARLSWMSQPASYYEVFVTPVGAPAPLPSTAATAVAQAAPFTMTGLVPDACYAFYVRSACNSGTANFSQWIGPFHFCTMPNCEDNGECPDHLALVSFVDTNNNGIKDTDEVAFNLGMFNYVVDNSPQVLHGYADNGNPFRIFDSNSNHSYNLSYSINPELSAYFSCTTTHTDIHVIAGSGSQAYYFPVVQLQPYQDLSVSIVPSGPARPGFSYTNLVKYKNNGLQTIASGNLYFIKDDAVTITSVVPTPTNSLANGFLLNFTNLAPQEERIIAVTMQVPTLPTVSLGQMLTHMASIENPGFTDNHPADNNASNTQFIVGSYDPNDKTEAHGGKIAMDVFTENDFFTYTIRFENTGTASAEFIRVEDLLDAGLNPGTVEMLSASHPYNMRRIGDKLVWNFYNINLPPTASNPSQSHGYIQFKVKPTVGYAIGTVIPNAADIYFDYNPAIVTDTFETVFVATLGNNAFTNDAFYMVPNPAHHLVRLGWKDASDSFEHIEIRDVLGKSMLKMQPSSGEISVDVSSFSKGVYFIEMTAKSQLKITKKLIVN